MDGNGLQCTKIENYVSNTINYCCILLLQQGISWQNFVTLGYIFKTWSRFMYAHYPATLQFCKRSTLQSSSTFHSFSNRTAFQSAYFTYHAITTLNVTIVSMSWFISLHCSPTVAHCHGFNALPVHNNSHPSPAGAHHREWWVHGWDSRSDSNASIEVDHVFWEVRLGVFDQTSRIVQFTLEWAYGALNLQHAYWFVSITRDAAFLIFRPKCRSRLKKRKLMTCTSASQTTYKP